MSRVRNRPGYTRALLEDKAAESASLVDMLRRLGQPLGSGPLGYLRKRLAHYGIRTDHFVEEQLPSRPAMRYTREALEDAAAQASSVREVLEYLDVPPYQSAYAHISRRLAHFGIDTSHFLPRQDREIDERQLRAAVARSASVAAVLRVLELPDCGTSRRLVQRLVQTYGISTAHFTGQGHNRGRSSPHRKPAEVILQRLSPGSSRTKRSLLHRALQEQGVPYVCAECGTGETWQGHRLVLEIDHVNGDRLDNRIENLRYLCPSCHSQTLSFSKPRGGSGRRAASPLDNGKQ